MNVVDDPSPATETEAELQADLVAVMRHSTAFNFLHDEPELYTDEELVERYK